MTEGRERKSEPPAATETRLGTPLGSALGPEPRPFHGISYPVGKNRAIIRSRQIQRRSQKQNLTPEKILIPAGEADQLTDRSSGRRARRNRGGEDDGARGAEL
jgi:hypothetical protein